MVGLEFLCKRNSLYVFKACFLFSAKLPLFLKVNGSLLQAAVAALSQTNLVTIVFTLRWPLWWSCSGLWGPWWGWRWPWEPPHSFRRRKHASEVWLGRHQSPVYIRAPHQHLLTDIPWILLISQFSIFHLSLLSGHLIFWIVGTQEMRVPLPKPLHKNVKMFVQHIGISMITTTVLAIWLAWAVVLMGPPPHPYPTLSPPLPHPAHVNKLLIVHYQEHHYQHHYDELHRNPSDSITFLITTIIMIMLMIMIITMTLMMQCTCPKW